MDVLFFSILDGLDHQKFLEIFGVATGILCVYFAAKNNIWNWPIAIVSVTTYIVIFWETKLYADMGLQFYFMITNFYGWYFWSRKSASAPKVKIESITKKQIYVSAIAIIVFTALLGFLLKHQTDASFPFIDSFCTACSLVAQFFLARKVLENWLIWIFADLIYVGVYVAKGLDLTAAMYALFIYIALMGYLDWRREYRFNQ